MSKPMSKDKTIVALREANAALQADVDSLSEAVGELEGEVVAAKGEAIEARKLAAGDAAEAIAKDLAVALVEAADARKALAEAEEALRWEKGGRADDEAAADKLLEDAREEVASKDEEIGKLEAKIEELEKEEDERQSEETETVLNALRDYLADLGYPASVHVSNISCPALRRFVEVAL